MYCVLGIGIVYMYLVCIVYMYLVCALCMYCVLGICIMYMHQSCNYYMQACEHVLFMQPNVTNLYNIHIVIIILIKILF